MKLFTIGDSISQGFMSGAAARTDLSFSTLLSRALGSTTADYFHPLWEAGGHPTNLENILRRLQRRYGSNIRGFEWLTVLQTINDVLDDAEDYYERGAGDEHHRHLDKSGEPVRWFPNMAIRGYNVADAWNLTSAVSLKEIERANRESGSDGYLTGPNASFYRTARTVLNPSLDPKFETFSVLKWLDYHAATAPAEKEKDGIASKKGVENLIVWLGSNNALGTVLSLKINQTVELGGQPPHDLSHEERTRNDWNLWRPDHFAAEFDALMAQTDQIMRRNRYPDWRVFVATVPYVTIAPIAKGVGPETVIQETVPTATGERETKTRPATYFKYYTYAPFDETFAHETGVYLGLGDAVYVDGCIAAYNRRIKQAVAEYNAKHGRDRYIVVDICERLRELAWKRNGGQPTYKFPEAFAYRYPQVNTKFYHADATGTLKQGGIFSLDGVHPSAIGHGLLAHEFLEAMRTAGVEITAPLDWDAIFASDALYNHPIALMPEIYQHQSLGIHLVRLIKLFNRKRTTSGALAPPDDHMELALKRTGLNAVNEGA